jgi:uncharacterized membrane protein
MMYDSLYTLWIGYNLSFPFVVKYVVINPTVSVLVLHSVGIHELGLAIVNIVM